MLPDRQLPIWKSTVAAALLCTASLASALPEDTKQAIDIDAPGGSRSQADGWIIYKGNATTPAKITQGTLVITGLEIRILIKNNEMQSATATGNPARIQVQPSKDQAVVYGNGAQINLNNLTKILTIDGDGEVRQDGNLTQSPHIERKIDSPEGNTGPLHMTIPPKKDKP